MTKEVRKRRSLSPNYGGQRGVVIARMAGSSTVEMKLQGREPFSAGTRQPHDLRAVVGSCRAHLHAHPISTVPLLENSVNENLNRERKQVCPSHT